MTIHLGNVPAGSTLYIPFATYDASGASLTMSGFAVGDIKIYKNGSTPARASTNGFTLLDTDGIDFDGVTGLQGFSVDLSDNTTAGFYAAGSFYWVVVSTITVNSQTVTLIPATFRIVAAENTAGTPVVDAGRINGVAATSVTTINANIGTTQPVNFTGTGASALAKSDMVDIAGAAVDTSTAQIGVNTVKVGGTTQTAADLGAAVPYIASGTASAATSDSITITFDGDPTGMSFVVDSDEGQENRVADEWDPINGVVTFVPAFSSTPTGTITWKAYPLGARVATQLEADVEAIKAQTDQFDFDTSGQVNANVKYVADTRVIGTGTSGDEWGPA